MSLARSLAAALSLVALAATAPGCTREWTPASLVLGSTRAFWFSGAAFSVAGDRLATWHGRDLIVWDVTSRRALRVIDVGDFPEARVSDSVWLGARHVFVHFGGRDAKDKYRAGFAVADTETGAVTPLPMSGDLRSVASSLDGKTLAMVIARGVSVFAVTPGATEGAAPSLDLLWRRAGTSLPVSFGDGGNALVTADYRKLRVHDAKTGSVLREVDEREDIKGAVMDPSRKVVFFHRGFESTKLVRLDWQTGITAELPRGALWSEAMSITPDGAHLVVSEGDRRVVVVPLRDAQAPPLSLDVDQARTSQSSKSTQISTRGDRFVFARNDDVHVFALASGAAKPLGRLGFAFVERAVAP